MGDTKERLTKTGNLGDDKSVSDKKEAIVDAYVEVQFRTFNHFLSVNIGLVTLFNLSKELGIGCDSQCCCDQHRQVFWHGEARESVSNRVIFTFNVLNHEIILREELLPTGLPSGEVLLQEKMLEGAMISVHRKRGAEKVNSPLFQGADNHEEFLFVYGVVAFSCIEG